MVAGLSPNRSNAPPTIVCPCLLGQAPDTPAACASCHALVQSGAYFFRWCERDHGMLVNSESMDPKLCHLHKDGLS